MENSISSKKHFLVCDEASCQNLGTLQFKELNYLKKHFCGNVCDALDKVLPSNVNLFLCGDIRNYCNYISNKDDAIVVKELSWNYTNLCDNVVNLGQVPINVNNVGVYFRNLFDDNKDYFKLIQDSHSFQNLTESRKKDCALRTGLYLSKVDQMDDKLHFNLLRCSTNFTGPTNNFKQIDIDIVDKVSHVSKDYFCSQFNLNHVLAQIYINKSKSCEEKETKASIKAHSDKTKDMPKNGLIAFTTFYDFNNLKSTKSKKDMFDVCYKETSMLTELVFKLKGEAKDQNLIKQFNVTLYPNSVFLIPLSTNRLYTHAIKPSTLPAEKVPTRMGYVIRSSKTEAIYDKSNGKTCINKSGELCELKEMNDDDYHKLRALYFEENSTTEIVDYGDMFFSMNEGDYKEPLQ